MTKRHKGIEAVAQVEQMRERQAAVRTTQQRRALRTQEERLAGLVRYHGDYAQSMLDALASGADSLKLAYYRNFLARLEEAIARQEQQVESSRRAHEQSHRDWLNRRTRADAVRHIVERNCAEQALRTQRHEEREGDADGLRQWMASRGSGR